MTGKMKQTRTHKTTRKSALLALGLITMLSMGAGKAYAQCAAPVSPAGGLQYFTGTTDYRYCDGTNWIAWGGSGSTPGTPDRGIQFNSGGSFAADAGITYTSQGVLVLGSGGTGTMFINGGSSTSTASGTMAIGNGAGGSLTSGSWNVFLGRNAGAANLNGHNNVFIGDRAGESNTTEDENVFIGALAGNLNVGHMNTFIGRSAGDKNTDGSRNTFLGKGSGYRNSLSHGNVAVGMEALANFTPPSGYSHNIAMGYQSLLGVFGSSTGTQNLAIGGLAGNSITTGSGNILLGYDVDTSSATASNELNIGKIFFGSGVGTTAGSKVGAVNYCDENLANCFVATDVGGGGGLWTAGTGDDIYYNSGTPQVGIGTAAPSYALDVVDGTSNYQMRLGYDGSNYAELGSTSAGNVELNTVSGSITLDANGGGISLQPGGNLTITPSYNGSISASNSGGSWQPGGSSGTDKNYLSLSTGTGPLNAGIHAHIINANGTFTRDAVSTTTGSWTTLELSANFGLGTDDTYNGSSPMAGLRITPEVNVNTGSTTGYAAIFADVTETSASSAATNHLIDMQVGGTSRFSVDSTGSVIMNGVGALTIPGGTTGERPGTGVNGMMRYNATTGKFEMYQAGAWENLAGASVITDLSDAYTDYGADNNVFMGQNAGASIASGGTRNTFVGLGAGNKMTTGDNNVFLGNDAGHENITGSDNVMIGRDAGWDSRGSNNIFLGKWSGNYAVGNGNVFIGVGTGSEMDATGDTLNTAVGHGAMDGNFGNGVRNTALGALSVPVLNNGTDNLALGYDAGDSLTNGNNNVLIGNSAAGTLTTGSSNIIIGYNVDTSGTTAANELNIGGTLYGDLSNDLIGIGQIPAAGVELDVLGDIEYTGTITDVSDRRLKDNINPLNKHGALLNKLDKIDTYSFTMKDDDEGTVEFGVMAQELEEVFPELVRTAEDEMGTKSVNYTGLIAPMIEATKELKTENDTLRAEISALKNTQGETTAALQDLSKQVALLNKAAGNKVNKASSLPLSQHGWLLVLLGLLGGAGLALIITRTTAKAKS